MLNAMSQQKRTATLQAKRARLVAGCEVYERVIEAVVRRHEGINFMNGGEGIACHVWAVVEVNDGRKVKAFKILAASSQALVLGAKFDAAMKAIPGVLRHIVHAD